MNLSFSVEELDSTCKGRLGSLQVEHYTVPTPALWLGHSLKSGLNIGGVFDDPNLPVVISLGDLLGRERMRERIMESGIHKHLGHNGPIMADSGGFKFMSRKKVTMSVNALVDFYRSSGVNIGVTLDHPFSLEVSKATNSQRWKRTLQNLERICRLTPDIPIMPVVHAHSLSQLENACREVRAIIDDPKLIGVGSLVPMIRHWSGATNLGSPKHNGQERKQLSFVAEAIDAVRHSFPRALLHVFGAGGPTTMLPLFALGADSVDSVGWQIAASYGAILLHGTSDRSLSSRPHSGRQRKIVNQIEKGYLAQCLCPICKEIPTYEARVKALEASFRARAIHNAWVVIQEAANFRQAISRNEGRRYLSETISPNQRRWGWVVDELHALAP